MLSKPFEIVIKELCEEVLPETDPMRLSEKIIDHVQKTFSVEWSTLWLTVQKNAQGDKQLRLAAAAGKAKRLLTAKNGGPAVYDFGEGLTGYIAATKKTRNYKNPEEIQRDPHLGKYDLVMYDGQEEAKKSCRCVLGVPLLLKSSESTEQSDEMRVIGVIKLENKISESGEGDYFIDSDAIILEGYAAVIAVALEKAQMREDSILVGQGLLEISESLLKKLGQKPDLKDIVKKTATVISAAGCSLWLRYGTQLRLEAAHGYSGKLDNIPPYNLETDNDDKDAGLTVFVAHTRETLNLKSMDEIKEHFAWSGANDQQMCNKSKGYACYSVMAIPLIDNRHLSKIIFYNFC